jgi:hypothetical protein
VGSEDIGPNRDGSLGERVSGGLPLASVEGLDSSQDGKADDHGRENQKEKLLLTHVSGFPITGFPVKRPMLLPFYASSPMP